MRPDVSSITGILMHVVKVQKSNEVMLHAVMKSDHI